jgi:hypothetical protein
MTAIRVRPTRTSEPESPPRWHWQPTRSTEMSWRVRRAGPSATGRPRPCVRAARRLGRRLSATRRAAARRTGAARRTPAGIGPAGGRLGHAGPGAARLGQPSSSCHLRGHRRLRAGHRPLPSPTSSAAAGRRRPSAAAPRLHCQAGPLPGWPGGRAPPGGPTTRRAAQPAAGQHRGAAPSPWRGAWRPTTPGRLPSRSSLAASMLRLASHADRRP